MDTSTYKYIGELDVNRGSEAGEEGEEEEEEEQQARFHYCHGLTTSLR